MRIRMIWEGKTKDARLQALQDDYRNRIEKFNSLIIEPVAPVRGSGHRAEKALSAGEQRLLQKFRGSAKILLDERGREWTSAEFARWLGEHAVRGTRELVFLVGGPQGFSQAFRKEADLLLALSKMTLTRDWACTLLLEQVYRGFTILRGFPYPR
jgi:23S rRNA (pseudouridine1915-N3)-methyltransferase